MMAFLLLAGASFAQVFALGFQSRNVNSGHYAWAAGTAFLIGLRQGAVWHQMMRPGGGIAEALVYSGSGAVAIVASMAVHQRFIAKGGRR